MADTTIKCIIVDDEPLAVKLLADYAEKTPGLELVLKTTHVYDALYEVQQGNCDLLFLDIQMPKINGFEMLELIEQPPNVIFTTAFDEYAIKAFDNHATDYLLKPFSQERFDKAIQRWMEQGGQGNIKADPAPLLETASQTAPQSQRIVVKTGGKIRIIPVDEVHYLEAADDYVKIHTKDGVYLKNRTMSHFEQVLDPQQFVRTHRSYFVNVQLITRLDPYEKESYSALLTTGARVPVSKTGYAKLKTVLGL